MATGTGKTKVGIDYVELLKNKGRGESFGLYPQRNSEMKGLNKNLLSGVLISAKSISYVMPVSTN